MSNIGIGVYICNPGEVVWVTSKQRKVSVLDGCLCEVVGIRSGKLAVRPVLLPSEPDKNLTRLDLADILDCGVEDDEGAEVGGVQEEEEEDEDEDEQGAAFEDIGDNNGVGDGDNCEGAMCLASVNDSYKALDHFRVCKSTLKNLVKYCCGINKKANSLCSSDIAAIHSTICSVFSIPEHFPTQSQAPLQQQLLPHLSTSMPSELWHSLTGLEKETLHFLGELHCKYTGDFTAATACFRYAASFAARGSPVAETDTKRNDTHHAITIELESALLVAAMITLPSPDGKEQGDHHCLGSYSLSRSQSDSPLLFSVAEEISRVTSNTHSYAMTCMGLHYFQQHHPHEPGGMSTSNSGISGTSNSTSILTSTVGGRVVPAWLARCHSLAVAAVSLDPLSAPARVLLAKVLLLLGGEGEVKGDNNGMAQGSPRRISNTIGGSEAEKRECGPILEEAATREALEHLFYCCNACRLVDCSGQTALNAMKTYVDAVRVLLQKSMQMVERAPETSKTLLSMLDHDKSAVMIRGLLKVINIERKWFHSVSDCRDGSGYKTDYGDDRFDNWNLLYIKDFPFSLSSVPSVSSSSPSSSFSHLMLKQFKERKIILAQSFFLVGFILEHTAARNCTGTYAASGPPPVYSRGALQAYTKAVQCFSEIGIEIGIEIEMESGGTMSSGSFAKAVVATELSSPLPLPLSSLSFVLDHLSSCSHAEFLRQCSHAMARLQ